MAKSRVESTLLLGEPHADPADRFLIAQARVGGLTLVTADQKIIDYDAAGHVKVLAAWPALGRIFTPPSGGRPGGRLDQLHPANQRRAQRETRNMNQFDQVYIVHRMLRDARRPIPAASLMARLECSRTTLTRLLAFMRDRLGAPLETNHAEGGYRYDPVGQQAYELPGLWFNPSELYALIATQQLLSEVEPGLLEAEITPLRQRIERLLADEQLGAGEVPRRIRILAMATRTAPGHLPGGVFGDVAAAVLQRYRLKIDYHSRGKDQHSQRIVSPQRLTHYRDNWYLDAWCHRAEELRSFALDRIRRPRRDPDPIHDLTDTELDAHFATAYGIFAGAPDKTAVLRFTAFRARWVADEHWHPEQQGRRLADGSYELEIPYQRADELILDILRYGPEVEVLAPDELRQAVAERLQRAAAIYFALD